MKGQFTIIALIMVFITLICFAILYPTLNEFIIMAQEEMGEGPTSTLLGLMPFFILIGILLTIVFYVIPHREE